MKIVPLSKKYEKQSAELLRNYWLSRKMNYSKEYSLDYVKNGHGKELVKEKFFVAVEKEVIGTMSVIVWEGALAELRDFVVKEEYRGKGIGELLFKETEKWCKKNKIRKVMALIFPPRLEFFSRHGYVQEGYLRSHYADGEDLIVIGKIMNK